MPHARHLIRALSALAVASCVLPLLVAAPAGAGATTVSAASATSAPTAAAAVVDARRGTLTNRPPGLPTSGSASAQRVASASVTQDLVRSRLRATVVLRGVPTAATNADLHIEFGHDVNDVCQGDYGLTTRTYNSLSAGFSRSGSTITLDKAVSQAGYMDWDCAFAATAPTGTTATYDGLVGNLVDVLARPKLRVSAVRFLSRSVTTVGLVRNVWTTLEVRVANSGRADAPATRVTGSGRGLRVRAASAGKVYSESSGTARVRVLLRGTTRTRLRLVARSGRASAVRTIVVKPVAAPRRPVAGRYRGQGGDVTFRIRAGRVVNFRALVLTSCGGYPDLPTYSTHWYDFPTTAVPRNGIIDRVDKRTLYTASLQLKAAGTTVSRGSFAYSGPNRCRASLAFTARRIGR